MIGVERLLYSYQRHLATLRSKSRVQETGAIEHAHLCDQSHALEHARIFLVILVHSISDLWSISASTRVCVS